MRLVQVAPLAAQNRVLFISGPAASDAVTGLNRYTFRAGRQSTQDVLAAKGILGRGTGRRVVVFAQDSVFGQGNVAAVRAILGGAGHFGLVRPRAAVGAGLHAVRAAREPDEP